MFTGWYKRCIHVCPPSMVVSRWHIATQNAEYTSHLPLSRICHHALMQHVQRGGGQIHSRHNRNSYLVIPNRFTTVFFITFISPFSLCVYIIAVIFFLKNKNVITFCTLYSGSMPSLTVFLSTQQTGLDWNQPLYALKRESIFNLE